MSWEDAKMMRDAAVEQLNVLLELATEQEAAGITRLIEEMDRALEHEHDYVFSRYCGCKVCTICGDHKGLARCWCGWSKDGGNGRQQLEEMGETIGDDNDYSDAAPPDDY